MADRIEINEEALGSVEVTDLKVNNKSQGKEFEKAFYPAVVKVSKMEDLNGTTRYTLSVDKESDVDVRDFKVFNATSGELGGYNGEFSDGDKFSIAGLDKVVTLIDKVTYKYSDPNGSAVVLTPASCKLGSTDITTVAANSTNCT